MRVCLWSSNSFENQYASYHIMYDIVQKLQNDHTVFVVQKKYDSGFIPDELKDKNTLFCNVSVKRREKNKLIFRYIDDIVYYCKSFRLIKKMSDIDVVLLQSNSVPLVPIVLCRIKKIPVVYNVQDIFPNNAIYTDLLNKKSAITKILL